ncbi:sigma-54-dependent transcriptional regulator [Thauera linaloolentis]|uniref:Sigma-54 dependent response regulator n=1 Tax=Thauera linaloolentis (strain DSM 12138 / JCM 21573 / CCUG 41526 / CIP 105981 / IAM 15112 / NBRC 102519 / 47Lol) TaxID=1123367 RepID=N6Z4P3_THAL4|nr:sigma-54 dependent transcriptional regulator [Thauera linaloolentis]ENO89547.1 sigma-54 dependent response regulator [Thauera linaloolentis 47Lol = DSM 12138]MCM8565442.1 sigma-54 dependent transcriptional regulator [Thauera linaloolentis]
MIEQLNILVVEDDAALRDAVCFTLEMAHHGVTGVDGGPAALAELERQRFNLVVTDLRMQPMDGLELLHEIRLRQPQLPVLLMTAYGDVDKAVAAMRGGACDFLMKPFEPEVLLENVRRYAALPPAAEDTVAEDPHTRGLLALAARVAETDATVLLSGESGTGKEVFARYIHSHSPRRAGSFIAINCAAIPENLLEATLFGYEKGAFTGAQASQPGKFEQAQGGTILLDEISEMPLGLQAKLLRVLQEREVERVGGKKPVALDIRVLATSNRDMQKEVAAGRFREDLYYRLNVFPIAIPALRERPGDVAPLARHFLAQHAARLKRQVRLSAEAEALLPCYPWPGNVRELENTLHRVLILTPGDTVGPETLRLCLPHWDGAAVPPAEPALSAQVPASAAGGVVPPAIFAAGQAIPPQAAAPAQAARPANMKDLEREHILSTLRELGGSRKKTVEKLGISERTLRYKLQQYRDEGYDV